MLEGSVVVGSWHGVGKAESTMKAYASYRVRHEQLLAEGAFVVGRGGARLMRDIVFSSPSTAGAVALGRSCNGRLEWVSTTDTIRSMGVGALSRNEVGDTGSRQLVDKLWSYCNVLRDDGVSTIEYTEQLTYLLFLKMAHERATRRSSRADRPGRVLDWQRLLDADGDELEVDVPPHPRRARRSEPGTLGTIFRKAQNRIQDPAKLKRLIVDLIDKENWSASRPTSRATPTRSCCARAPRT